MRYTKDGMELVEVAFRGVKVDQCSHCSGLWLDAGEMDDVAMTEKGGFLSGLGSFLGSLWIGVARVADPGFLLERFPGCRTFRGLVSVKPRFRERPEHWNVPTPSLGLVLPGIP